MTPKITEHPAETLRRDKVTSALFTRYCGTTSIEHDLLAHSRQRCEVVRPLTRDEADIDDVGQMYHIRFADGFEADAYDDELSALA